jgi:hypothetical protein
MREQKITYGEMRSNDGPTGSLGRRLNCPDGGSSLGAMPARLADGQKALDPRMSPTTVDYAEKVRSQFLSLRQPDFKRCTSRGRRAENVADFARVFVAETAVGAPDPVQAGPENAFFSAAFVLSLPVSKPRSVKAVLAPFHLSCRACPGLALEHGPIAFRELSVEIRIVGNC